MCNNCKSMDNISAVINQYKNQQGALIPVLHAVQKELGFLPKDVLQKISRELKIPLSEIYGTTTFYSLLYNEEKAEHIIRVCENGPCHVTGYQEIIQAIQDALGIEINVVSPDKKFYLEKCACLGVCAEAPAIMIDDQTYTDLTPEKVKQLLVNF